MNNKIFILSIIVLIAGSCGQRRKSNNAELQFLGEWYSVERDYPFSATLKIDSNHNFIYTGGACILHFRSKGKWRLNGNTLILNSFEPKKCCFISEFGVNCSSIILNDSIPFEPSGLKTSIKDCIPSSIDQYILFNNEKFLIEDSVLTYIQKLNALCPEIKDNFTRWQ